MLDQNIAAEATTTARQGNLGAAIMRITLGVIVLVTWWSNITGDTNLYSGDGLRGLLNWLGQSAEEGGNGGSLGFVHSILDSVVAPNAGFFGFVQGIVEFLIGLALLLGIATRAAAIAAFGFFATLFLAYFGGEEWIWTYVLLMAGAVVVFLDQGGRLLGLDQALIAKTGEPKGLKSLLW